MTSNVPAPQHTSHPLLFSDISIIQSFAQISATVIDLDDLLTTALDILSYAFSYDLLAITLVNDNTSELDIKTYQSCYPIDILDAILPSISKAVSEGKVVKLDNFTFHLHSPQFKARSQSCLIIPLTIGRLVIGSLIIANFNTPVFSPPDQQLLTIFASQLTVAISNAQLYKRIQRQQQKESVRRQIATHLQQLTTIINATLDMDDVLDLILERVAVVIPYTSALIMLLDGRQLLIKAARGFKNSPVNAAVSTTEDTFYRHILSQQYPIVFHSVRQHIKKQTSALSFTKQIKAWIGAPLMIKNKVTGIMTLHHTEAGYFDTVDLELVHTFANQAAIAIENAQLYHREQQKVKHLQIVAKIGQQVAEIYEVQPLLDTVIKRLNQDLNYEYVTIFLYDSITNTLRLKASSDILSEEIKALNHSVSLQCDSVVSLAARAGEVHLINDVNAFPSYFPGPGRNQVQSELAVPLTTEHGLIGVLDIQANKIHAFSPDDLTLAQTVGNQLAIAIKTANLFEERDQRIAELSVYSQIGVAIADPRDLDKTLTYILERLKMLYQVEGASLLLLRGDTLHFKTAVGIPNEKLKPFTLKLGQGFAGWAAKHNKTLRIDNVAKDSRHYKAVDEALLFETRSILAIPVQIQDRVLGVMEVMNRLDGRPFSKDDEIVLAFIASAMAITIENSRLFSELTQKVEQLAGLFEASRSLTNLDLDEVLTVSVKQTVNLLKAQSATVYLLDKTKNLAIPGPTAVNDDTLKLNPPTFKRKQGIAGWVTEHKTLLRIDDAQADPRFHIFDNYSKKIKTLICAPLIASNGVIGALAAANKEDGLPFTEDDEALMTTLASQAAIAIYNAQLHQETELRLSEVATLYTLARQTAASLNIEQLLKNAVTTLHLAWGSLGCSIFLLKDGQLVQGEKSGDLSAAGHAFILQCVQQMRTKKTSVNYQSGAEFPPCSVPRPQDLNSLLMVPLLTHGNLQGILAIYDDHLNTFGTNEERLFTIIATQIAAALENSQLYNNLQQHAKNLESTLSELQRLHQLQGEFVQNVSHELRTPLTFIKGYVDLILEDSLGPVSEKIKSSLEIVSRRTADLSRLVSEIVTHQELKMDILNLKKVDLNEVISLAVQSALPTTEKRHISLTLNIPSPLPNISADPDRISQVLDNLIGNAIKFTNSGGKIVVSAHTKDNFIKVTVSDTGIGIAPEDLDKVFDRFYQVNDPSRQAGGTGLGLAIIKQIIDAHHGQVKLSSKAGEGSQFSFTLPIVQAETDPA
ncbi:MAG: hypothetical protein B6243_00035 [Anaerolineaceae bacterium 4572_5.2]|nr:MAG: hypothetical protein B6243_00035 [Anaerolineaceae bacterium 4572_5.2]